MALQKKQSSTILSARMQALTRAHDLAQIAKPKVYRESRSSPRVEVFKEGLLVTTFGEKLKVIVKNVSQGGVRVDFACGSASIRGRLQVREPTLGIDRWACVVWKSHGSAGLQFEAA